MNDGGLLGGALPTLEVVLTTILFLGVGIKGVLVLLRRFAGQAESFTGKVFRFILAVVVVFGSGLTGSLVVVVVFTSAEASVVVVFCT